MRGKKGIYDQRITDYNIMREMRWTKAELDGTPENDVQSITLIIERINIQAKLEGQKGGK